MDWILPLRSGENEECKFAIRSWIANADMLPEDRLVVIGGLPTWLEPDLHLKGNPHKSGPANVFANVRDACAHPDISEHAVIANDDQYALEPVDVRAIAYRGPLREHIARLPAAHQTSWWASSLRLTHNLLRHRGVERPLSYELHRPLFVDADAMARTLTDCWNGLGFAPQWRSVYGNLHEIGGEQVRDGKVVSRANWPTTSPWLSSTDGSWRWLREHIEPMFPDPSRFEKS